jgi:hypothetical protein
MTVNDGKQPAAGAMDDRDSVGQRVLVVPHPVAACRFADLARTHAGGTACKHEES